MQRIPRILAVVLLTALAAVPNAAADEQDERRVADRNRVACPELQVLGGPGAKALWIGRSPRGFLGVEPTALTPELRRHFGVPEEAGVMVARVVEDSSAAAAGLSAGDVITRIDEQAITSPHDLGRAVRQKAGGDEVVLEYWRERQRYTATVTLGEHERCGLDIGQLPLLELEHLEKLGEGGFALSEEALDKLRALDWEGALHSLRDIDWEKKLEGMRMLDVERFEERMDRMRERLERLESALEREQERLERLEERRKRSESGGV